MAASKFREEGGAAENWVETAEGKVFVGEVERLWIAGAGGPIEIGLPPGAALFFSRRPREKRPLVAQRRRGQAVAS